MKCSDDLIKKVEKLYPDSEVLRLVKEGHELAGRYLDDSSQGGIPPDWILKQRRFTPVRHRAKILIERKELYAQWLNEYREQR